MAKVTENMIPCRARMHARGRWLSAYRRPESYQVKKSEAQARAFILGLPRKEVPNGEWYSVLFCESRVIINGALYEGGSGWREIPAAWIRDNQ